MKNITSKTILLIFFIITGCSTPYYQLVELESLKIKKDNNDFIASNHHLGMKFDFWANGGSTSFDVVNMSDKTIYIKYDECHLVINGESKDYYDNSLYTSTSSILKNRKRSNTTVQQLKIYGKSQINISSFSSTSSIVNSRSKTEEDKLVLILPPSSFKEIDGFKIQVV